MPVNRIVHAADGFLVSACVGESVEPFLAAFTRCFTRRSMWQAAHCLLHWPCLSRIKAFLIPGSDPLIDSFHFGRFAGQLGDLHSDQSCADRGKDCAP